MCRIGEKSFVQRSNIIRDLFPLNYGLITHKVHECQAAGDTEPRQVGGRERGNEGKLNEEERLREKQKKEKGGGELGQSIRGTQEEIQKKPRRKEETARKWGQRCERAMATTLGREM